MRGRVYLTRSASVFFRSSSAVRQRGKDVLRGRASGWRWSTRSREHMAGEFASKARWGKAAVSPSSSRAWVQIGRRIAMARILVVEDEPSIALALEDDLRREGYSVDLTT